jgi:hypothetical protein
MGVAVGATSLFRFTGIYVILGGWEVLQANCANLVEGQDMMFARLVALQVSVSLPLASSVVDFDIGKGPAQHQRLMMDTGSCPERRGGSLSAQASYASRQHHCAVSRRAGAKQGGTREGMTSVLNG